LAGNHNSHLLQLHCCYFRICTVVSQKCSITSSSGSVCSLQHVVLTLAPRLWHLVSKTTSSCENSCTFETSNGL